VPKRESYEPGIPSWIDLMSPDVDASTTFYAELFGWDAEDQFEDGERIYTMFRKDGRDVAGLGGQGPGMDGMPPIWNTYVATDDIAALVGRAEEAGGTIAMAPMQVGESGTMAFLMDPAGAGILVWQADQHIGAQTVNEDGSYIWSELLSRQKEETRPFYEQTFGWKLTDQDMGPMGTYTTATLDGEHGVAGMADMPAEFPDRVPNHWLVYLAVDDVDATCAKAEELGGSVVTPAMDAPGVGRFATLHDPLHGSFAIMTPEYPSP